MEEAELWLFTEEHLFNTPSRGLIDETNKSFCRKQDANFILQIGGSLENPLPIITAVVYMHRFYMVHYFEEELCLVEVHDHRCKVEEVISLNFPCRWSKSGC
ncbi:hypothetical protein TNIN_350911 [Trichonephila inaurata madagascariensis]|uniref:Uncharacterized protein n=1 Tax=Trichonephila inaurata madagascariensis TaxID=2747483 RepID=A0A8X6IFX9_9ARAC|nr:hypothetical protein TNIN_350911 [Trichonephila inaurata madagascariensis]